MFAFEKGVFAFKKGVLALEKGVIALREGRVCVREGRVRVREGRVCVREGGGCAGRVHYRGQHGLRVNPNPYPDQHPPIHVLHHVPAEGVTGSQLYIYMLG